eukprot:361007-Chlamydomonas_euryale.AAC.3
MQTGLYLVWSVGNSSAPDETSTNRTSSSRSNSCQQRLCIVVSSCTPSVCWSQAAANGKSAAAAAVAVSRSAKPELPCARDKGIKLPSSCRQAAVLCGTPGWSRRPRHLNFGTGGGRDRFQSVRERAPEGWRG